MNPNCPPEIHPFTNRWFNFNEPALTSEASAAWIINQEKGYFGFLPNRQIKHLIIGSFPIWASVHHDPPHPGFEFAFFYCSRVNGFFRIMNVLSRYNFLSNSDATTPHQKVGFITNFFLEKGLGITDIILKVKRTGENWCSADDALLEAIAFNQVMSLLYNYEEITHLYFTSGNVHKWFKEHLRNATGSGQIRSDFYVKKLRRKIVTHDIISPSSMANTAISGKLNKDDNQYQIGNRLREHMLNIPFVLNVQDEKDQFRVVQWAKHLRNVPDLVCPEILNHPSFIAIETRL